MSHDHFGEAVWGEVWLKVRKEMEESRAQLTVASIDSIVDYRITKMAEKLVALLDKD